MWMHNRSMEQQQNMRMHTYTNTTTIFPTLKYHILIQPCLISTFEKSIDSKLVRKERDDSASRINKIRTNDQDFIKLNMHDSVSMN